MTNGHTLGANEVGHQACLGDGGRHTTWTCCTFAQRCTGHRSTSTAGQGLSPAQRLCSSPRRRSSTPTAYPPTSSADRRCLAAPRCRTPSLGCCACATSPRLTLISGCSVQSGGQFARTVASCRAVRLTSCSTKGACSICDSLAADGGGEYLSTYVRRVLAVS